MAIGGVTARGMADVQTAASRPADFASRKIQNEISDVQRSKQGLSSKQGMSAEEKARKERELRQELSGLNAQLRRSEAEAGGQPKSGERVDGAGQDGMGADGNRVNGSAAEGKTIGAENQNKSVADRQAAAQEEAAKKAAARNEALQREAARSEAAREKAAKKKAAEEEAARSEAAQEEAAKREAAQKAADQKAAERRGEELQDIGIPQAKERDMIKADAVGKQTQQREEVIARMERGIAVLKSEIRQEEIQGTDATEKKAELKRQRQKVRRAASGLPDVGGPSEKTDKAARSNAGRAAGESSAQKKNDAATVRSTQDGVVIIRPEVSMGMI